MKPVPLSVAALIVTDAFPVEVNVRPLVAGALTVVLPKARLVELKLSTGVVAFSSSEKVFEVLSALAVSVMDLFAVTAAAFAMNPILLAFSGTVTVSGTVTSEPLLDIFTTKPPLGALLVRVTVQASVPDPVSEAWSHDRALTPVLFGLSDVTPVPLKLTIAFGLIDESVAIASFPVTLPAAVGSN